jgi:hypothetical protein
MHLTGILAAAALAAGTSSGVAAPLAVAGGGGGAGAVAGATGTGATGSTAPGNIIVMPATVRQGGTLTITVDGASCRGTGRSYDAIVESDAFPRTPLKAMATQGASYATPQVFAAARPGTYHITAACGGKTVTGGRFTVVARAGSAVAPGDRVQAGMPAVPDTAGIPAKAGAGASKRSVDSTETALGATALAAAVAAAGVFLIRRRPSGRS